MLTTGRVSKLWGGAGWVGRSRGIRDNVPRKRAEQTCAFFDYQTSLGRRGVNVPRPRARGPDAESVWGRRVWVTRLSLLEEG